MTMSLGGVRASKRGKLSSGNTADVKTNPGCGKRVRARRLGPAPLCGKVAGGWVGLRLKQTRRRATRGRANRCNSRAPCKTRVGNPEVPSPGIGWPQLRPRKERASHLSSFQIGPTGCWELADPVEGPFSHCQIPLSEANQVPVGNQRQVSRPNDNATQKPTS